MLHRTRDAIYILNNTVREAHSSDGIHLLNYATITAAVLRQIQCWRVLEYVNAEEYFNAYLKTCNKYCHKEERGSAERLKCEKYTSGTVPATCFLASINYAPKIERTTRSSRCTCIV